ncbi:unnamed protein product [Boreogadus saida]
MEVAAVEAQNLSLLWQAQVLVTVLAGEMGPVWLQHIVLVQVKGGSLPETVGFVVLFLVDVSRVSHWAEQVRPKRIATVSKEPPLSPGGCSQPSDGGLAEHEGVGTFKLLLDLRAAVRGTKSSGAALRTNQQDPWQAETQSPPPQEETLPTQQNPTSPDRRNNDVGLEHRRKQDMLMKPNAQRPASQRGGASEEGDCMGSSSDLQMNSSLKHHAGREIRH